MAIPTGPAGRGKPRSPRPFLTEPTETMQTTPTIPEMRMPASSGSTARRTTDRLSPQDLARARAAAERAEARGLLERTPSEIHARHEAVSPAILTLTLADFFDLFYQNRIGAGDITIDELLQMRDNALTLDDAVVEDIRSRLTYPAYEKLPHMPDELKKAAHDPLFERGCKKSVRRFAPHR